MLLMRILQEGNVQLFPTATGDFGESARPSLCEGRGG